MPNYTSQEGDFGLFDLGKNGQVKKIKFDFDETQVWGVGHETSMLDSTHNDLHDDINMTRIPSSLDDLWSKSRFLAFFHRVFGIFRDV